LRSKRVSLLETWILIGREKRRICPCKEGLWDLEVGNFGSAGGTKAHAWRDGGSAVDASCFRRPFCRGPVFIGWGWKRFPRFGFGFSGWWGSCGRSASAAEDTKNERDKPVDSIDTEKYDDEQHGQ
jgi:hypothetical protein